MKAPERRDQLELTKHKKNPTISHNSAYQWKFEGQHQGIPNDHTDRIKHSVKRDLQLKQVKKKKRSGHSQSPNDGDGKERRALTGHMQIHHSVKK